MVSHPESIAAILDLCKLQEFPKVAVLATKLKNIILYRPIWLLNHHKNNTLLTKSRSSIWQLDYQDKRKLEKRRRGNKRRKRSEETEKKLVNKEGLGNGRRWGRTWRRRRGGIGKAGVMRNTTRKQTEHNSRAYVVSFFPLVWQFARQWFFVIEIRHASGGQISKRACESKRGSIPRWPRDTRPLRNVRNSVTEDHRCTVVYLAGNVLSSAQNGV